METYRDYSNLYKILSHPVRLAVLDILRDGEQCVCHIEAALGLRQAYISQQLMVLREAGIIEDRREGWNIFYRIVKPEVIKLLDQTGEVMGKQFSSLSSIPKASACPCPKCNLPGAAIISSEQVAVKE
jgi:ArsR family transcriptional regulator